MSDLFSIYEDSLNIVNKNIHQIIDSMKHLSKDKTENALNEAHNCLKEADRILKQMELEVESDNQSSKVMPNKFRTYKNDVDSARKKFMKLQENYINQKSKDALIILESLDDKKHKSQKKKLIDSEDNFDRIDQKDGPNQNSSRSEVELSEVNDSSREIKIKNSNANDEPFPTQTMNLLNEFRQNNTRNIVLGCIAFLSVVLTTIIIIYSIKKK